MIPSMKSEKTPHILIVDDESDIRNLIQGILEDDGYVCEQAEGAKSCFEQIAKQTPDLIILDIWLRGSEHDGLEILSKVKEEHPTLPVIMISGHGTIETAVDAIKKGAYDFIEKPFKSDRLLLMIRRALENAALQRENISLKKTQNILSVPQSMIGESTAAKALDEKLRITASGNSRIILSGERGTGKEMVAKLIHRYSERADETFLNQDCNYLEASNLENLFYSAQGGTLYLGYIDALSPEAQNVLAKFLQTNTMDGRLIVGTSQPLSTLAEDGGFSADLFAQIDVTEIKLPPLRKRAEDVPALLAHYMGIKEGGLLTDDAWNVLTSYKWPGNITQLYHVGAWMNIIHHNEQKPFDVHHLPPYLTGRKETFEAEDNTENNSTNLIDDSVLTLPLREARELFEKFYLGAQIERFDGNISKTASFIGMERSALHRKIKNLDLNTADEKDNQTVRKRA